jgi:hypothetical protein
MHLMLSQRPGTASSKAVQNRDEAKLYSWPSDIDVPELDANDLVFRLKNAPTTNRFIFENLALDGISIPASPMAEELNNSVCFGAAKAVGTYKACYHSVKNHEFRGESATNSWRSKTLMRGSCLPPQGFSLTKFV